MARFIRSSGLHIALLAMLLHALLPAGWMPNPGGGAAITICTANGPADLAPGKDDSALKGRPPHDSQRHPAPCPFFAAPHFATFAGVAAFSRLIEWFGAVARAPEPASIAAAQRHAPQSPRAPPVLV